MKLDWKIYQADGFWYVKPKNDRGESRKFTFIYYEDALNFQRLANKATLEG